MRLDKFIGNATGLSRSQVRKALKAGSVTVNDRIVGEPARQLLDDEVVTLNGEHIQLPGPRYFMLNKPEGYVCATWDSEHPTVIDIIDEPGKEKLQIAGRLDIDTTGLVLITDNGHWNHNLTSPKRACDKVYRVTLADPLPADAAQRLARGILLKGEKNPTLPARLERIDNQCVRLIIQEGRYHQVKRMFGAMGNRVVALHRERIGAIQLDSRLKPGQYRALTREETEWV